MYSPFSISALHAEHGLILASVRIEIISPTDDESS
jgi:hypothetical protein